MDSERPKGFLPGQFPVDAYGEGGFKFGDMSHRGSILALPSGVYAWSATSAQEINPQSLERLFAEPRGSIELLIVGTGRDLVPASRELRDALREAGIRVDTMGTGAAVATYNILLGERRRVAAAFLAVP